MQFFLNACILVTFISILHIFQMNNEVSKEISLVFKIFIGVVCGVLGIILMLSSVHVTSKIIVDFRYIPILFSAIYFGPVPAMISAIVIAAFRVLHFGISEPSMVALIDALIIGIGFSVISCFKIPRKKKCIISLILLFFICFVSLYILLGVSERLFQTLVIYYTGYIFVSWIVFSYTESLVEYVRLHNKFKAQATKDFLTGLNNVRQFDVSFNQISKLALRKEEKLSLLFIDIDYFKKINDTYGHNAGDIVLKDLAEILVEACRVFDVVSRNGGEEFSVLLLDCSAQHAIEIAERMRKKVKEHKFSITGNKKINITISIGVSTYPDTTDDVNNLLEDADKALYEAKRTGRDKVVLYKKS